MRCPFEYPVDLVLRTVWLGRPRYLRALPLARYLLAPQLPAILSAHKGSPNDEG